MGVMELMKGEIDKQPEKVHTFQIQTPQGVRHLQIKHSAFKRCHCGCDRFHLQYHVTWAKTEQIGAPPVCLRVETHVCANCGEELTQAHPCVGDEWCRKCFQTDCRCDLLTKVLGEFRIDRCSNQHGEFSFYIHGPDICVMGFTYAEMASPDLESLLLARRKK